MKAMLSSFPKNRDTAWFVPQTKKLEPHCVSKQTAPHMKAMFSSFSKNGDTAWFVPQTKKLEPHCASKKTQHHMEVLFNGVFSSTDEKGCIVDVLIQFCIFAYSD